MRLRRMAALAALMLVPLSSGAAAQTCSLQLMASLDMTMLPDGRFAVPVSVNGTTLEFMVDTAGVFSEISTTAANELGLKTMATGSEMYGVSGKIRISSALASSFMLGRNEAKNFHLAAVDLPDDPVTHLKGILSLDMLDLFDVELDFAKKKMNLFSQDHCPGKVVYWTMGGFADVAFHQTEHIRFDMTLDGQRVSTALDTGSATTWIRHKIAVRDFGFDDTAPGVERSPISSEAMPAFRKQFGLLAIGGVAVQNPVIDVLSEHMEDAFRMAHSEKSRDDPVYGTQFGLEDLTLGMNVIGKLHLYIANKEHKIYVTAADAH